MRHTPRPCATPDCDADLSLRHPTAMYCYSCSADRNDERQRHRRWRRAAAASDAPEGECTMCGATIPPPRRHGGGQRKRLCSDCRHAANGVTRNKTQAGGAERRTCLSCGEKFDSWGHGNRMCGRCRHRDVSPYEPEWGKELAI